MSGFVHAARLHMGVEADDGAPGAAITTELCGHWEHEGPCPLAPHHTAVRRRGEELSLRTVFVVDPAREAEVRERIAAALGREPGWTLLSEGASDVRPNEAERARRIGGG